MPPPIDNLHERLGRGIDYFNHEYFFEAHDEFEELWMDARDALSRTLFHGLVHLATGFYHYRMDNFTGMKSQLRKGLERLRKLPSRCHGVNVERLLEQIEPFVACLTAGVPVPALLPVIVVFEEESSGSH